MTSGVVPPPRGGDVSCGRPECRTRAAAATDRRGYFVLDATGSCFPEPGGWWTFEPGGWWTFTDPGGWWTFTDPGVWCSLIDPGG